MITDDVAMKQNGPDASRLPHSIGFLRLVWRIAQEYARIVSPRRIRFNNRLETNLRTRSLSLCPFNLAFNVKEQPGWHTLKRRLPKHSRRVRLRRQADGMDCHHYHRRGRLVLAHEFKA